MIRYPVVAGQFYPDRKNALLQTLDSFLSKPAQKIEAIVAVSPHAGYVYSGAVAGRVLSAVNIPDTVVLLGPNHSGLGASQAIMSDGEWVTPLGSVPINAELAASIIQKTPGLTEDSQAHSREHSLEVQLPFLKRLNSDVAIVPICQSYCDFKTCEAIGRGVARAIAGFDGPVLMVASTDMTHYESADSAKMKDDMAIKHILDLDAEGLLSTVRNNAISMCGVIPTTTALVAAKDLGATRAEVIAYANSGDVNKDYSQVVGYAGIVVT